MYKIRKGVLLEQICGVYLLITSDEARPPCPYFREVNETIAFYWHLLEQGYSEDEMLKAAVEEFEAPTEVLKSDLLQLLDMLEKQGYLLKE